MTSIMEAYSLNSGPTYKEEIIKKLRVYSYKTISNIIDDCLARGYIKYVNNYSSNNPSDKLLISSLSNLRSLEISYRLLCGVYL